MLAPVFSNPIISFHKLEISTFCIYFMLVTKCIHIYVHLNEARNELLTYVTTEAGTPEIWRRDIACETLLLIGSVI
jgi:hypothetical protein